MLWFVGLGVSGRISADVADVLGSSDHVYLEQFTSPVGEHTVSAIQEITKGRLSVAKRWQVEDGSEILKNAKDGRVALVSYGDPMIATTHAELMTRAVSEGIRTHMIHGASAVTATVGECGMHYYKVGRVATIMNDAKSVGTPYYVIHRNLVEGNHTVLLLEYNHEEGFFLGPGDALALLVGEEAGQRRNVIRPDTFAVVASRVGTPEAAITGGQISHLAERDFGGPPHSIIIPGRMHFTESDALRAVADCIDEPLDNSRSAEKVSVQMIKKYAPMIRKAISDAEPYRASAGAALVLENAECYMQDAMRFLEQGKDDLAVLSIGYADGLLDALRMVRDAESEGGAA